MVKTIISLVILIGLTLILSGCVNESLNNKNRIVDENKDYKLLSTSDFKSNQLDCVSTGNSAKPSGFDFGVELKVIDFKSAQEIENGRGWFFLENESGGNLKAKNLICFTNIDTKFGYFETYAIGYTPKKFKLDPLPKDKIVTIEVPLKKSCSEKIYDTKNEAYFFDRIKESIGLKNEDYRLECMESEIMRGGFIKATGKYKDGSNFELFYHWGWCSSGGADCIDTLCFSAENGELFNNVNEYFVKKGTRGSSSIERTNCLSK